MRTWGFVAGSGLPGGFPDLLAGWVGFTVAATAFAPLLCPCPGLEAYAMQVTSSFGLELDSPTEPARLSWTNASQLETNTITLALHSPAASE